MGDHPGIRLKEELHHRHVSARQAARSMGIPANRLTEIMRGRRGLTIDTAYRVAIYLGQPVEDWYIAQAEHDMEVFDAGRLYREVEPWESRGETESA